MPGPIPAEFLPNVKAKSSAVTLEFSYRQVLGLVLLLAGAICAVLWPLWFRVHDLTDWQPRAEDHFKSTDGQVVGLYSRVRVCEARLHIDPSRP